MRVLAERLESRGGGGRVRVGVVELMLHGSRGGGVFHLEVGIRGIGPIFLVKRRDGSAGAAGWSRRLGRRWKRRVLVRGFEVSDTLFQVAEVVDAGLEGKLALIQGCLAGVFTWRMASLCISWSLHAGIISFSTPNSSFILDLRLRSIRL